MGAPPDRGRHGSRLRPPRRAPRPRRRRRPARRDRRPARSRRSGAGVDAPAPDRRRRHDVPVHGRNRRRGVRMGVSLIQSNASGFGSHLVEPTTGINLHNRGIGFHLAAGAPGRARSGPPAAAHAVARALASAGRERWRRCSAPWAVTPSRRSCCSSPPGSSATGSHRRRRSTPAAGRSMAPPPASTRGPHPTTIGVSVEGHAPGSWTGRSGRPRPPHVRRTRLGLGLRPRTCHRRGARRDVRRRGRSTNPDRFRRRRLTLIPAAAADPGPPIDVCVGISESRPSEILTQTMSVRRVRTGAGRPLRRTGPSARRPSCTGRRAGAGRS